MNAKDFARLTASIKEAGEIKAGRKKPDRVFTIRPPEIKEVRAQLDVSQAEFALMINDIIDHHVVGVSLRTLQNWEQGRRNPDGPAKALLKIAVRNPRAVLDALHS